MLASIAVKMVHDVKKNIMVVIKPAKYSRPPTGFIVFVTMTAETSEDIHAILKYITLPEIHSIGKLAHRPEKE